MAQNEWMEQLKTLAAQRAAGGDARQPQTGAESGAPPFTWKFEVKGQGPQGMPSIPGMQPPQAPAPQAGGQEGNARRRQAAIGLAGLARRAGFQMPGAGAAPGGPPPDPSMQYARLHTAALQPVGQGPGRDQALQALLAGAGRT